MNRQSIWPEDRYWHFSATYGVLDLMSVSPRTAEVVVTQPVHNIKRPLTLKDHALAVRPFGQTSTPPILSIRLPARMSLLRRRAALHCPAALGRWSAGNALKFHGHPECRDVPFEPILCIELLIVTKIENHRSVHQQRVVNEMRPYAKNAAFEWTKLST